MNDEDRKQWVSNDEGLYSLWQASGKPLTTWLKVKVNRQVVDEVAENVRTGKRRQHYLAYGG